MNKGDLIDAIAKDAGLSKVDAGNALNAFVSNVSGTLNKGENVQLIGFGTFSISARAARTGRNPQSGAEIKIAAKKVAKFKAGKALSESVN
jgi:DNA-binding protein HU-beta